MTHVRIPDLQLLKVQRGLLESVLTQLSIGMIEGGWNIPLNVLERCAEPSNRHDPEECVIWMRKPDKPNLPKEPGVDEFVMDWVMTSGLFQSKATAMTVFVSLMTHVTHWLVNKRKPVNLIFARMTPMHYRRNWKEVVLGRFLVDRLGHRYPDIKWLKGFRPTGKDLCHEDLLAYDPTDKICEWTLECEPSNYFRKASNERERNERRAKHSDKYYLPAVVRTIMEHRDAAADAFSAYTRDLVAKVITLPTFNVSDDGVLTKIKERSTAKVGRPARAVVFPHCLTPDSIAACVESNASVPIDDVPGVPSVQPGNDAVRDTGPDVLQPSDGFI
jgi:hypothetical protein